MPKNYRAGILITGDASKGVRAIKLTREEVKKLNTSQQRGAAQAKRYKAAQSSVTASIKKAGIAITAGAVALTAMTKKALNNADAIGKQADQVGLSTDAWQEYIFAASQSGVSQEKLTSGMGALNKRVGELKQGTGSLNTFLKAYDEELYENVKASKSTEEAAGLIFDAMGDAESSMDRAALSAAAFSRGAGIEMQNMVRGGAGALEEMRKEAQELGIVLKEDLIRKAEDSNDRLDVMQRIISAQMTVALVELAPVLAGAAEGFAALAQMIGVAVQEWKAWGDVVEIEDVGLEIESLTDGIIVQTETLENLQEKYKEAISANPNSLVGTQMKVRIDLLTTAIKEDREELERLQKTHGDLTESQTLSSDAAKRIQEEIDKATESLIDYGSASDKTTKKLKELGSGFTDADKEIEQYIQSLTGAQAATELLQRKQSVLWQLYKEGAVSVDEYNTATDALGLAMGDVADETEAATSKVAEYGQSIRTDLSGSLTDAILAGDSFGDALEQLWDRILGDLSGFITSFLGAGLNTLFDSLLSGKGFDLSGFAVDGLTGGSISGGAANAMFAPLISGAKEAGASIAGLAASVGSYFVATEGATVATAALATKTTVAAEAYSATTTALTEATIATYELTDTALIGAESLEAFGGAGAEVTAATEGMSASMSAFIGVSAFAVGAMVLHSQHSKKLAETQEEIKTKFQDATNVIHTGALTWGEWGDQALIALNSVNGGEAQNFSDTMSAIDVSVRTGGDGFFILGNNIERARFLAENYSESVAGAMNLTVEGQQRILGLLETEGEDRAAILDIQRQATEEWEASLQLINSINFDPLVAEFSRLTGEASEDFRTISSDGFITANELATKFNWSAGEIEEALGGAAALSVTEFLRLQGIGTGAAGNIKSGFSSAADEMAKDMAGSTDQIQSAIDSLHGVTVHSTNIVTTKHVDRDAEKATGTRGQWETVPSGFPNDSYTLGLQSGEQYMVKSAAEVSAGNSLGTTSSGGNKSDDRVVARLDQLIRASGKQTEAIEINTKSRKDLIKQQSTQAAMDRMAYA